MNDLFIEIFKWVIGIVVLIAFLKEALKNIFPDLGKQAKEMLKNLQKEEDEEDE